MRKPIAAALVALLAGGCMVGPDYVRPPVDAPAAWRLEEKDVRDLANTAWWEQFGDPVLNDLVAVALRENKDLLIASARVDEYAGRYGFVRAELFPQVGAGVDARRQRDIAAVVVGAGSSALYNSYSTVLNASWEIDLWGRIRRQTEAARAQLLASEDARQGVIMSLVGSVAGGRAASATRAGRVTVKVAPWPGTPGLAASMVPPIISTRRRLIARPSPLPP